MGHNAFDTAVEVLGSGFTGEEAVEEWMRRIGGTGERYCPIAFELLMSSAVETTTEEQAAQTVSASEDYVISLVFDGELSFGDVPGEPVDEEG